jgi:putative methionine-R-sulfoxide reductase with GAF domain
MFTETGNSSAVRLRKLAEASSLLLVLAAGVVLLAWALNLPIWPAVAAEPAVKMTPAVIAFAVGAALWVAMTVLLWFTARALHVSQKKVEHRERLYAVLSQCNQSIVHIAEREPLLKRLCEIAVQEGGFRMAWIGLANPATEMVDPVASAGTNEGFFDRVKVSLRDEPLGRGPGSTAIREKRTVICNDVHNDSRLAVWRDETLGRGFHSAAGFPIRSDGDFIGCFVLYSGEVGFFNDEEVKLLVEMACDITLALGLMERFSQRRGGV